MKRDYGRTTITVPWELKARMKKARSQVNWSAVACDAFEQKLDELGPIEEINSVEDALERMKSIKSENESQKYEAAQSGHEAGRHWALNFARPGQLRRMEAFRDEHSETSWAELMTSRDGWIELGKCLSPKSNVDRKHPNRPPHDDEVEGRRGRHRRRGHHPMDRAKRPCREKEIWRRILDERPDHPGFFLGFATGALEVWDQIKDQF